MFLFIYEKVHGHTLTLPLSDNVHVFFSPPQIRKEQLRVAKIFSAEKTYTASIFFFKERVSPKIYQVFLFYVHVFFFLHHTFFL